MCARLVFMRVLLATIEQGSCTAEVSMSEHGQRVTHLEPPEFYARALALGVEMQHHEGDLYLPVTADTAELVRCYRFAEAVTQFRQSVGGTESRWYSIPFGYYPYFEQRNARAKRGRRDR